MARTKQDGPTENELAILSILWQQGPSTVRQVNEQINKLKKTGYTTTLKLMQIMTDKGMLKRDNANVQHIYRPAVSQEKTQSQIVDNLLKKAFAGSAEKLVMRALNSKKISRDELANIRQMIDDMEGK